MKIRFPVGMRTIKTALCVLICLLIYRLFYYLDANYPHNNVISFAHDYIFGSSPGFACIASVICMQDTIENSVNFGISRIIGSVLGGVTSVIMSLINTELFSSRGDIFLCVSGVIFLIWLCNKIGRQEACSISVITFLLIIIGIDSARPLAAAINRTSGTILGGVIAISINRTIKKPR